MTDQKSPPTPPASKSPVEQALDVLVYAPLGLAFSARELLPTLAEKGRNQLGMAKMIGQFAAQQGQKEAEKTLGKVREQAISTLEQLAGNAPAERSTSSNGATAKPTPATVPVPPAAPKPAGSSTAATSTKPPKTTPEPEDETPAVATPIVAPAPTSGPEAASLAIPDYDSLSASQVLPRLQGLAGDELEAVRTYEAAHRGRKTILNRVTQLQSS